MVHTLKVVWTSSMGESEIRRATVHDDVISHYDLLAEKIVKLFPGLAGQCFQVGWKDSEGDFIVMSSDEELAQAVANAEENGLIRVFVTTKVAKATEKKRRPYIVHAGVECDGCNDTVVGYRYKCLECLDYDLCEACHMEDKHPMHDMLKISTLPGQSHNWMFPGWRRMYRSMFGRHPFGARYGGGKKFESKQWKETDKKEKEADSPSSPHAEILRSIGKTIAFMLDPLGIDVDVLSENDTDAGPSGSQKGADSQTGAQEQEPKNVAEEKTESDKDSKTAADDDDTAASSSAVKDEETVPISVPQGEEIPAEPSDQGARPKNYGLFQIVDCSCDAKVDPKESTESSPENLNGHDDWTVVNNVPIAKDDKSDLVIEGAGVNMRVSYPELPEEKLPSDIGVQDVPQDPKIANALSKMCAMGFTNEGGWLVRLLETKNGNINEVLDALYPNRH